MTTRAATASGDTKPPVQRFTQRVAAADWDLVAGELNEYGCAPLPQLLTPDECAQIAALRTW
jgi:hypothetical protein